MAESLNIGVPWIMCQESDAPVPMINTCNGWHCDSFTPTNPNTPKMWTENWIGWFKSWGGNHPHRTAEHIAFFVTHFFQRGGTYQNYYMLHQVLKSMEKTITYGDITNTDFNNIVSVTKHNFNGTSSCFFSNANKTAEVTFEGTKLIVPVFVDTNDGDLMSDKDEILLRVNTSGHVLHAFVNGEHVGSQWATNGSYKFVFEQNIKLNHVKNQISFLSATVGLRNYGPEFDSVDTGLAEVQLMAKNNDRLIIKDLSAKEWIYKVGLHGEDANLHNCNAKHNGIFWVLHTTLKAPSGTDAVVVDLKGMGKGHAWVNGKSIGRLWPSFLATNDGIATKHVIVVVHIVTRSVYHVSKSFLHVDSNTLILFEEVGGNPSKVNFQTIEVGF
ncbi:hypothetical protein MKW92_028039, partial [Papaver armeniacum]